MSIWRSCVGGDAEGLARNPTAAIHLRKSGAQGQDHVGFPCQPIGDGRPIKPRDPKTERVILRHDPFPHDRGNHGHTEEFAELTHLPTCIRQDSPAPDVKDRPLGSQEGVEDPIHVGRISRWMAAERRSTRWWKRARGHVHREIHKHWPRRIRSGQVESPGQDVWQHRKVIHSPGFFPPEAAVPDCGRGSVPRRESRVCPERTTTAEQSRAGVRMLGLSLSTLEPARRTTPGWCVTRK